VWFRGNRKAPVGGLGDHDPQKLKRYGKWGGNMYPLSYRVTLTQTTYPVPDLMGSLI